MLATVDDLSDYMDMRFTNRQSDAAELILAGLQSELETYLRRPIEPQEFTEIYVIPEDYLTISGSAYFYDRTLDTAGSIEPIVQPPYQIHLRNSPVISVDRIRVKSRLESSWRTLTSGTDYIPTRWGIDTWAAFQHDEFEIDYRAGLNGEDIPYLKLLILRAASREMQEQTDDVVGLKNLDTREPRAETVGFTDRELAMVKRYKRKQI
jgi:hypothetical protein